MKFKITKQSLEFLLDKFKKDDSDLETIELEPVVNTAFQATYELSLKQNFWQQGYERGFKEGMHKSKNCNYHYHYL